MNIVPQSGSSQYFYTSTPLDDLWLHVQASTISSNKLPSCQNPLSTLPSANRT